MAMIKKINSNSEIIIDEKHLEMIKEILQKVIPKKKIWAYGSRVNGFAKKHSDLDLVVFDLKLNIISELKEEFEESNIPFRVDVLDWNKIPESFQKNIKEKFVIIQKGE